MLAIILLIFFYYFEPLKNIHEIEEKESLENKKPIVKQKLKVKKK